MARLLCALSAAAAAPSPSSTWALQRLCTETYAFRDSTIQVLEQCGFRQEGRLREHVRIGERWVDALVHGCLHDAG
jgi:RimJ/RimL family protein N-acetyltransferase